MAVSQSIRSTQSVNTITGLENGSVSFVDYDNDGDLDMLITGSDSMYTPKTELYQNTGTGLGYVQTSFYNLASSSADWGDFDNDGDEDLLLTGYDYNFYTHAVLYSNEGGGVFSPYTEFPGSSSGEGRFCDFNNDGFLDVIITGDLYTDIYQNFYYEFYYTNNINIFSVYKSSLDVSDYDKDGDMDVIITGATSYNPVTYEPILPELRLYRNDGNFNFTVISLGIAPVSCGSVKFGDYDNDGDPDLLVAGKNSSGTATTNVYRNDNGSFININAGLTGIIEGEAKWGDLDNDGKLDIILTGGTSVDANGYLQGAISKVYYNNGSDIFTAATWSLYPSSYSSVAVADLDGDHALDYVICGYDPNNFMQYTDMYINSTTVANSVPTAPTGLISTIAGNAVTLKWNRSTDAQTPSAGLSYNVRISSYPNGQEVVAANSNLSNGFRRIVAFGNTSQDTTYTFDYMPGGTVYWSVQAIDQAYEGSPFSVNGTFILPPLPPQLSTPSDSNLYVSARPLFQWNPSVGASTYRIQVSGDITYTNIILDSANIGTPSFQIGQDLNRYQTYYWHVKATNVSGTSDWSETWAFVPDINVTTDSLTNVCAGDNIQLNATVQGGNSPISYLWTPGNHLSDSTIANPVASLTNTETFVVKVMDAKGWWKTDTLIVIVRPLPTITAGPDIALWPGESGQITSQATGGTPPYSYAWTPALSLQTPSSQNPIASPSAYTQYTVLATDSFGCVAPIPDTLLVDVMTITQINPGITGFTSAGLTLGDYDNDNDLDLLISGQTVSTGYNPATKIYRNNNGVFTDINAGFDPNFVNPALWADFDNDGDLDVFANYYNVFDPYYSLYKNDNGTFTNQNMTLTSFFSGDAKAIDYDNDGDLDVIACGNSYIGGDTVILFVNNNGTFTEVDPGMIGVREGKLSIYDFDKDGDMDVAIAGTVYDGYFNYPLLQLYKNDNGVFTEVAIIKTEIMAPALNWADINGDGYDDLLVSGYYTSGNYYYITKIYTNYQTYIQEGNSNTIQVAYGSFGLGDLDNDGDHDVIVSGRFQSANYPFTYKALTRVYRNQGIGTLTDPNLRLMGFESCATAVGDYDNDGDLDIFISGKDSLGNPSTLLYKIDHVLYNNKPNTPTNLQANVVDNRVTLSWTKPTDEETPSEQLKYNVYIGTSPGGINVCSPMSNPTTGYTRNPAFTNGSQKNEYRIELLPAGTYYWGVQAVDNGEKGSDFATGTFTVTAMQVPILLTPTPYQDSIPAITNFTWTTVPSATQYQIQITDDPTFQVLLADVTVTTTQYQNTHKLTLSTHYYWRVKAIGTSNASGWSAIGHFRTFPQFSEINAGLPASSHNTIRCVDFDNDNDLDVAFNGVYSNTTGFETVLFKNDTDTFTKVTVPFMGVSNVYGLEWADYNKDGHADLLISGADGNNFPYTKLYKNNGNSTFSEMNNGLPYTKLGSIDWGDYDNDGDPDILINGVSYYSSSTTNEYLNKIYRNDNGTFVMADSTLPAVTHGVSRFFDYNNDGLLDVVVIGNYNDTNQTSYPIFKIFRNTGTTFVDIHDSTLIGMTYVSIDFGDFDSDGFTDMVTLGSNTGPSGIIIYKNNGGVNFTPIIPESYPQNINSVHWGDYDSDGDLDLLVPYTRYGKIYFEALRNDEGVFKFKNVDLIYTQWGDYSWIDYDKDHDLDLIVSGLYNTNEGTTRLYRNNSAVVNTRPTAPTNVTASIQGSNLIINWNGSNDAETPTDGLTYNIAVSSILGSPNICYPLSNLSSGYNKVVNRGNSGEGTSAIIKGINQGMYYIVVQSIDNCFEGSPFSTVTTVSISDFETDHSKIQVYPNPTTGTIWITLNSEIEEFCRVDVIDITGKTVFTTTRFFSGNTSEKIDLPSLSKGLYLIKVVGESTDGSQKIIFDTE